MEYDIHFVLWLNITIILIWLEYDYCFWYYSMGLEHDMISSDSIPTSNVWLGIDHFDMIWYDHGTYGGFPKSWGYPKSSKHRHAYINNHFSIETHADLGILFLKKLPMWVKRVGIWTWYDGKVVGIWLHRIGIWWLCKLLYVSNKQLNS
jgi:hypothetical protein